MLPMGGLHVKHAVQRGILGTSSAFALGSRKTTENLDRVGRSQDLPDTNWLLASSPALNTRTLKLVPICAVALLGEKFTYFFYIIFFFYMDTLDEQQTVVYNICGWSLRAHSCMQAYIYLYLQFFRPEVRLNNICRHSSYLTGNTLHLRYKAQPVNAV
jgi:hypothetical protein